jgi:hypothetical protein
MSFKLNFYALRNPSKRNFIYFHTLSVYKQSNIICFAMWLNIYARTRDAFWLNISEKMYCTFAFSVPNKKSLKLHLCLVLKLATPVSLSTYTPVCLPPSGIDFSGTMSRAGIFKQSMGARNQVGIGLSYRLARLHSLSD